MSKLNKYTEKSLRDDERINAFMHGTMSKEKEVAFLKEMESDEELRSKAVDLAYLTKAMIYVGKQRDEEVKEAMTTVGKEGVVAIAKNISDQTAGKHEDTDENQNGILREVSDYDLISEEREQYLKELIGQREAENKTKQMAEDHAVAVAKGKPIFHRIVKTLSVAACIAILCVAGIHYYDYRETTGLGKEYASAFASEQYYSRGEENTATKELSRLYSNVQNGTDLDATIHRLSVLWEVSTLDTYNDYTDEAPLIGWNLAIAYLKDNDKKQSEEVLNKLINTTEGDNAINKQAKELLGKLK